jgi:hypothetical protein
MAVTAALAELTEPLLLETGIDGLITPSPIGRCRRLSGLIVR